jgi:hypothetical protein
MQMHESLCMPKCFTLFLFILSDLKIFRAEIATVSEWQGSFVACKGYAVSVHILLFFFQNI